MLDPVEKELSRIGGILEPGGTPRDIGLQNGPSLRETPLERPLGSETTSNIKPKVNVKPDDTVFQEFVNNGLFTDGKRVLMRGGVVIAIGLDGGGSEELFTKFGSGYIGQVGGPQRE